jgi:hypothetical protein
MIKNVYWSSFKFPLFLSDFNEPWISPTDFSKNNKIYFMNIRLVTSELFHEDTQTDRRTDMTKLIVAFHNFAIAPEKGSKQESYISDIQVYNCK